ncbi:MAG TPA: response regulator [Chloroflexi bacterium]|nr:response regulator [Chloroflexota bacterium]
MARILIAEDEKDIRDLIFFVLGMAGHEVTATRNGKELYETAISMKDNPPDLVMTDVRMPHMNGYEACAAIKAEAAFQGVPVVILSAKGQDSEIEEGMSSGADEYILKPFAPDQLMARVAEILAKYGKA